MTRKPKTNLDALARAINRCSWWMRKAEKEEESPIANLKSDVEALLSDLSASAGPEQEEEGGNTTSSSVREETSTTSTSVVQDVQSIGEVEDDNKEAEKTEGTMES